MADSAPPLPPQQQQHDEQERISSLLDTDLYKLTMQCAILKYFPDADVTYFLTNRTPDMKFTRQAYNWLAKQVNELANISLTAEELEFLKRRCPYLNNAYLRYLSTFRFKPSEQIEISFTPVQDTWSESDIGDVKLKITGLWVETILYEIPLLALTSMAYFKWCDRDWDYEGQEESAFQKGVALLQGACTFSEFGTRRRRDYHTQELVMRGLMRAVEKSKQEGWKGIFSGTSNVHFAMVHDVHPVGTVAHEWYMGIAAITNDYENANELASRYWIGCFGEGVLGVALTDTFGTPEFLKAFSQPIPSYTTAAEGSSCMLASTGDTPTGTLAETEAPITAPIPTGSNQSTKTYAEVFKGVRQDSGDPAHFVKMMRDFYDQHRIEGTKTIVFSDSLNIERCFEYKEIAEKAGFWPAFGVGTFLTNDFKQRSTGKKSVPLNIVIKIASAGGRSAVKISDNLGKNTGDPGTVAEVKQRLGYVEREWRNGDETQRWGKKGE
ncbi:nicotinate phosphoribosyltransferase [Polytolypa hystricis UAMH7299]|uniref:nicotinate phosphoribosyltransferase n=1 Tax=Polytolypa hystricis (strain UAMH7299) TaxID=1447883 RepID=A0A2B7Z4K9_POLH7|nr:nicotinate phosphoribosyltransferase [Polytolypa hystricis UAMH7299]